MASVRIIGGYAHLTDEINAFAASVEPAEARWRYAAKVGVCPYQSKRTGEWSTVVNDKTLPALARLMGCEVGRVRYRLGSINRDGFDEAWRRAAERDLRLGTGEFARPFFWVGPLQPWCFGHVYFARVESYPHVVKVGFSRRVRDRLNELASKSKVRLVVPEGHLKVGTQADEHWWHKNWERHHIEGEWFFDPHMAERSLPDFLQKQEAA